MGDCSSRVKVHVSSFRYNILQQYRFDAANNGRAEWKKAILSYMGTCIFPCTAIDSDCLPTQSKQDHVGKKEGLFPLPYGSQLARQAPMFHIVRAFGSYQSFEGT